MAKKGSRIASVDGLRAISILIVLLGHGSSTVGAPEVLQPMQHLGIVGVEIFFAISGFVITLLYVREYHDSGTLSLRGFWMRRALRILPPFLVACAGLALAAHAGIFTWWWSSLWGAVSFTKDFPWFSGDWFFGHFWSLSVEEQFYLFWPLLFLLLASSGNILPALFGLILAGPILAQLCAVYVPALQNLLPFLPDLAVGCLLALLWQPKYGSLVKNYLAIPHRGRWFILLTVTAVISSYLRRNDWWPVVMVPVNALICPLWIGALLFETAWKDGLLNASMTNSALRAIGLISYSLYLWQQLFFGPGSTYDYPWFWSQWPQNIIAAVACASVSYFMVEKPFLRISARLSRIKNSSPDNFSAASSGSSSKRYSVG